MFEALSKRNGVKASNTICVWLWKARRWTPREPKPPVDQKLVFGPSVKNHTIKIELLPETFLDFVEPFGTRFEPVNC